MEDVAAYFYENVLLAYHQYQQVKTNGQMGSGRDRRYAIEAAIALFHFREHLPPKYQKTKKDIITSCGDYALVEDIANIAKHNKITHYTPQIQGMENIYEILVSTTFRDNEGEYVHEEKIVETRLSDGTVRDLNEILVNVLNMWFSYLQENNIIKYGSPFEYKKPGVTARKNASRVGLEITKGIRWHQVFRFQKFNYETGKIEVVDLSHSERIVFSLRQPKKFDIELRDENGVLLTRTMEMTPEQEQKLSKIDDPKLQDQFLLQLAESQGIINQMKKEYFDSHKNEK